MLLPGAARAGDRYTLAAADGKPRHLEAKAVDIAAPLPTGPRHAEDQVGLGHGSASSGTG